VELYLLSPFVPYWPEQEEICPFKYVMKIFSNDRSNGENKLEKTGYIENFIQNPAGKIPWKTKKLIAG
jgi:hypothetical protein